MLRGPLERSLERSTHSPNDRSIWTCFLFLAKNSNDNLTMPSHQSNNAPRPVATDETRPRGGIARHKPQAIRSMFWCFTLNNPTSRDRRNLFQGKEGFLSYAIYQQEIAPTTGTPHLQGYLILKFSKPLSFVNKLLGGHANFSI